ncbi:MAG: hypothetical protein J7539_02480 [Niabella sp.]|nr:hypothetical protein [Niabella sp.]
MSLNKIDLPSSLVAQLYPRSLSLSTDGVETVATSPVSQLPVEDMVLAEESSIALPQKTTPDWKSLGSNHKNITVVVDYATDLHLPDPAFGFLSQMLNACKLGPNDVAIINRNNYRETSYQELLEHFKSKTVLLFGVTASAFGFPFETPHYQVQNFSGYTVMHAPTLDALQDDKPAKMQLWSGFKKIFNL